MSHLVYVHIEDCKKSIRITVDAVCFDGRAQKRLGDDELRQLVDVEIFRIGLEELGEESFYSNEVDRCRIEEIKVYIDKAVLVEETKSGPVQNPARQK